jgi:hypothetical protein
MRDLFGGAQSYEYAVHRTVATERLRWLAPCKQYRSFYGLLCSCGDQVIAGTMQGRRKVLQRFSDLLSKSRHKRSPFYISSLLDSLPFLHFHY